MPSIIAYFFPQAELQGLIDQLIESGYQCVGPQVRDGGIVYDTLSQAQQLPWGIRERQAPGAYYLESIPENEAFAWANGAQAIKPLLFKPKESIWKVERDADGKLHFTPSQPIEPKIAVIGARACDLAAMSIQDQVFMQGAYVDVRYQRRRTQLLVVAVNCTYSSANCFCVSAGTGPEVSHSYDLLLDELPEGFIVRAGTAIGSQIIAKLTLAHATAEQQARAQQRVSQAAATQQKQIPLQNGRGLRDALLNHLEHPRWAEVAERCLSCGNCTSVCPTCFCHTESDHPQLSQAVSEHERRWDSCFTAGHSYVAGEVLRDDTRKRYRQWLTHKVGTWFDQFDTSGCVGCGRCITWCPVGIDLTEELAILVAEAQP